MKTYTNDRFTTLTREQADAHAFLYALGGTMNNLVSGTDRVALTVATGALTEGLLRLDWHGDHHDASPHVTICDRTCMRHHYPPSQGQRAVEDLALLVNATRFVRRHCPLGSFSENFEEFAADRVANPDAECTCDNLDGHMAPFLPLVFDRLRTTVADWEGIRAETLDALFAGVDSPRTKTTLPSA